MRIALLQLASFGDCLYATIVARQIKRDYPSCKLTWVISNACAPLLADNDDVDEIHVISLASFAEAWGTGWTQACRWAQEQEAQGKLDLVIKTQILPNNYHLYDGLIRATIYRGYPGKVEGPYRPYIVISQEEIDAVATFSRENELNQFRQVLLFECGPRSGQSSMNPARAEKIAHCLAELFPDLVLILSSTSPPVCASKQVVDGSVLTFRQNAALANLCDGLVGCSSGITWLTTSSGCKPLPMLQVVTASTAPYAFASVVADFRRYGMDDSLVIEMIDADDNQVLACLKKWLLAGHAEARNIFHTPATLSRAHVAAMFDSLQRKLGILVGLLMVARMMEGHGLNLVPIRAILAGIIGRLHLKTLLRFLKRKLPSNFKN